MPDWTEQFDTLLAPAIQRSNVTKDVMIGSGILGQVGTMAASITDKRKALVMADCAGFVAAGQSTVDALASVGFDVRQIVLPNRPLPKASIEEAEPFCAALSGDKDLFPVSVGSGVINDLVKYAAFRANRRYMTVATAASMDGYTSAGAPLAQAGFKVTVPTCAPIALLADLDVIAEAPPEMNGWGFGDLAGKVPTGGDWMIADALGIEAIDDVAWPLIQDHLLSWLDGASGIADGDPDAVARLFIGLTAVGFAMEFHGSSRPASGAEHQIAHLWEMTGLRHQGRKVSHGAAVAIGSIASLALYDWLLQQDLTQLDTAMVVEQAPSFQSRCVELKRYIPNRKVAENARLELEAKHATADIHTARLERLKSIWPDLREQLSDQLIRAPEMMEMLRQAGAPSRADEIGVTQSDLLNTLRAAAFIRRRYTILDLLHETGLWEAALRAVVPKPISPT